MQYQRAVEFCGEIRAYLDKIILMRQWKSDKACSGRGAGCAWDKRGGCRRTFGSGLQWGWIYDRVQNQMWGLRLCVDSSDGETAGSGADKMNKEKAKAEYISRLISDSAVKSRVYSLEYSFWKIIVCKEWVGYNVFDSDWSKEQSWLNTHTILRLSLWYNVYTRWLTQCGVRSDV